MLYTLSFFIYSTNKLLMDTFLETCCVFRYIMHCDHIFKNMYQEPQVHGILYQDAEIDTKFFPEINHPISRHLHKLFLMFNPAMTNPNL